MKEAVAKAEAAFGPCNIMICNAGATEPGIIRAWVKGIVIWQQAS